MNCLECRGACCEQLILPLGPNRTVFEFMRARGQVKHSHGLNIVILDCRCPKLDEEGLCSIYEQRPVHCRAYKAGGAACIEAVRRNRTKAQFSRIREDGDPES